jgi:hypothetical protein
LRSCQERPFCSADNPPAQLTAFCGARIRAPEMLADRRFVAGMTSARCDSRTLACVASVFWRCSALRRNSRGADDPRSPHTPGFTFVDWIYLAQHLIVLGLAFTRRTPKAQDHSVRSAIAVTVSYAYPYAQIAGSV